jgi:TRAP-type mannitol/chloroaromatic compound transport system substrate-binding protein
MVSVQKFNELPKTYQKILELASAYGNTHMMAMYDARNPAALKRLIAAGTQLRPFPADVLDGAFKAATDLYTEISAQNADFKRMYENAVAFRNDFYLYNQLADYSFDTYMIRARART